MIKITKEILEQIIRHGREEAPIEACGYLAGTNGEAVQSYRLRNIDRSPEHFSFDPAEQFEALKKARAENLRLIAVYHSHPASPARPSEEDIKLAYDPDIHYIIVSLLNEPPDVKSFIIRNGKAEKEDVEVRDA